MTVSPACPDAASSVAASPPEAEAEAVRGIQRAAADLRRGFPVLLDHAQPLVLLAAETASDRTILEFRRLTQGAPMLLVAPTRAAAILHRPVQPADSTVALLLHEECLRPDLLRALADPTLDQARPGPPTAVSAPEAADAAFALTKLSRLLPAVLAGAATPDAAMNAERLSLLRVAAAAVLSRSSSAPPLLSRITEARVPLDAAEDTRIIAFRAEDSGVEHLAIVVGDPNSREAPLVRLHSECFTGDLLGSLRCDCGLQLREAVRRMAREHAGVLLYLAQEGRGIGLVNKLRAYALQDRGLDTLDANRALGWGADERDFLVAAAILQSLGLRRIRLLTNNPDKLTALEACGIEVAGRVPHAFAPNGINDVYLATKARRLGHLFDT